MRLSVFDLHCDTAQKMLDQKQGLASNSFAVSMEQATKFDRYVQVMAHFIDDSLSDGDGWQYFLEMNRNLRADSVIAKGSAKIATEAPLPVGDRAVILSLEDARVLENDLSRVDTLYECGIRIITPLWAGKTVIGGSHDTNEGLTPFGRAALSRALEKGILLDVSHASVASAEEIFALSRAYGAPVIASHSNAYSVCPVSRNLRDGQVRSIIKSGGLIGLNFYTRFLNRGKDACIADLFPHIDHLLALGASSSLCLGMDMDGCDLPRDLPSLSALDSLAEKMLAHNYSEELIRAIFFENADRFFQAHLGKPRNI